MIRLINDNLGRALHASLYKRIHDFCVELTPEIPADKITDGVLNRLYSNDPSLLVMVDIDDNFNITEHAVIEIQNAFGYNVVNCHQLKRDVSNMEKMDAFMEFLDKLAESLQAACITFTVTKGSRAYEKRYGYKTQRSVMIKMPSSVEAIEEDTKDG